MSPTPFVYKSLNVIFTAVTAVLLASAIAAPTSNQAVVNLAIDLTAIAQNSEIRKCEVHKPLLDAAFHDAVDMASAAVRAIDRVQLGRDNWIAFSDEARISASLQAVFGVKTGAFKEPMTEMDSGRLEVVQGKRPPIEFSRDNRAKGNRLISEHCCSIRNEEG